jgi:ssDNA thymidine ADP-ribosyltransferase, DarT
MTPMNRGDIAELHFITSGSNLRTIGQHGILSNTQIRQIPHTSVAKPGVQDIRAGKIVPGQRPLHQYANLYFDARNPMMYLLRCIHVRTDLVVVRVSPRVLDLPGTVVTDGNAATATTRFLDPKWQLEELDQDRVRALSWNHADPFIKAEQKRQRCAEVLVPDKVPPNMLLGCYVEHAEHVQLCHNHIPNFPVEVNSHVYFQ